MSLHLSLLFVVFYSAQSIKRVCQTCRARGFVHKHDAHSYTHVDCNRCPVYKLPSGYRTPYLFLFLSRLIWKGTPDQLMAVHCHLFQKRLYLARMTSWHIGCGCRGWTRSLCETCLSVDYRSLPATVSLDNTVSLLCQSVILGMPYSCALGEFPFFVSAGFTTSCLRWHRKKRRRKRGLYHKPTDCEQMFLKR